MARYCGFHTAPNNLVSHLTRNEIYGSNILRYFADGQHVVLFNGLLASGDNAEQAELHFNQLMGIERLSRLEIAIRLFNKKVLVCLSGVFEAIHEGKIKARARLENAIATFNCKVSSFWKGIKKPVAARKTKKPVVWLPTVRPFVTSYQSIAHEENEFSLPQFVLDAINALELKEELHYE